MKKNNFYASTVILLASVLSIVGCTQSGISDLSENTGGSSSSSTGEDKDVNTWVSAYMSKSYLWNGEFKTNMDSFDYSQDAETFFYNAISSMTTNSEDGKIYDGSRYYYSYLSETVATSTKALSTSNNYGINMVYYTYSPDKTSYYMLVAGVNVGSPAEVAGIERGMYITSYNGSKINDSNINEYYSILMGYTDSSSTLTLTMSQYQATSSGSYTLTDLGDFTITPAEYENNPIIYHEVFEGVDTSKKIGYLVYSEFDMDADERLLEAFSELKTGGANELVLDLRYNGGGDVYSSTLMATAIVGAAQQNSVYCELEFNETRKASGEVDYFYIGANTSFYNYQPIKDALNVSLDLNRVYVIATGFTASSSELVINGLRGLGVEVILIGQTTEGKNVGMEVIDSTSSSYSSYDFDGYEYELAPITFYSINAEGFKDYSAGFDPDHTYYETYDPLVAWGNTDDYCLYAALHHINYGSWPIDATSKATGITIPQVTHTANLKPRQGGSRVYRAEKFE